MFFFVFLVTPCLGMAVQSYIEWIPNQKKGKCFKVLFCRWAFKTRIKLCLGCQEMPLFDQVMDVLVTWTGFDELELYKNRYFKKRKIIHHLRLMTLEFEIDSVKVHPGKGKHRCKINCIWGLRSKVYWRIDF